MALPSIPSLRAALAQAKRHMDAMHTRKLAADKMHSAAVDAWMEAQHALDEAQDDYRRNSVSLGEACTAMAEARL